MTCYCRGVRKSQRKLRCHVIYSIEKKEEHVAIEEVEEEEVDEGEEAGEEGDGEERYGTSCSS
jgi:hypothetical protein